LTEIPEHLLKRSRERRAALGLGGGDAGSAASGDEATSAATPASSTPATTSAAPAPAAAVPAAPVEAKPEPPKPVPAYVQAAQRRRRVPFWAMPVLAAVPLWGYVFFRTLDPPPVQNDPLVLGEAEYSSCAACHGGSGQGVSAPALADGAVLKTWPDYRDHMMWVRLGSQGWPAATYGANDTATNAGVMPSHPQFTDQELAQVVLYERQELSGEDPAEEEDLLAIANGEKTFEDVGLGPMSEDAGVTEDDLAGGG
jgi:mono/diheme cytochrome c family protein